MDKYSINLISLIVLLTSFVLFRIACGSMSLKRLNMLSFTFYIYLFLMTFVGSVLIVNEVDNHYLIQRLKDQSVRFEGWMYVCYMMISFPIGIILAKLFFKFLNTSKQLREYISSPIIPMVSIEDKEIRFTLYILSGVGILATFYTLYNIQSIALIGLFRGNSASDLLQQRSMSTINFAGIDAIRNLFGIILTTLMCYVSYAYYQMTKNRNDLFWFLILFITSAILLLSDLQKAPFLLFLSGFVLMHVMINPNFSVTTLFKYGVFAFVSMIIAYSLLSESFNADQLFSYNQGIFGRTMLTSVAGLYHSLEIFPETLNHLGFTNISAWISDLFNMEFTDRVARQIMIQIHPDGVYHGTVGYVNSIFLSEAWANFGITGILISPVYVGFIHGLLYYYLLSEKKTPLFLGVYAFFSYRQTVMWGFNDYIYNVGNVFVFGLLLLVVLLTKRVAQIRSTSILFSK